MNARDDEAVVSPSLKRPQAERAGQGAGAPAPLFGTSIRTSPRSVAPVSAARQRKLHVGHFAFMRSVVQGLDPRESWERYFRIEGEATDQRTVRATIAWIRDEFAAAAKREDRFGAARLVRIDATRIADPSLELPSLEAFAEAHGLEDERQADQIAAYEAEYGRATERLRRRARLIARQLEALRWLENLVAQSPKAGDSVAAWLNPTLASHLEAADIFTLAQLVERINGVGQRWYAGIKAMGEGKAQRIVEWLQTLANTHQNSIALQLGRHVAMPRSKLYTHELQAVVLPATDIRPLEKFIVPAELDGTHGLYRRPQAQCLLKATNDYQAILAWLRSKHGLTPEQKANLKARRRQRDIGVEQGMDWLQALSHTQRAYRKEAERFLLWAVIARRKALSSLDGDDCVTYRDFLASPGSEWVGPRHAQRWSEAWRPFEGGLSARSQATAMTIVRSLCEWLVRRHYLDSNPWDDVPQRPDAPAMPSLRALTHKQWALVMQWLQAQPPSAAVARLDFLMRFAYLSGMRLSELSTARLGWLRCEPLDDGEDGAELAWSIMVLGKRNKWREVPLPDVAIEALGRYLAQRGLASDPLEGDPQAPLVARLEGEEPLSAARIYDIVTDGFERCAADLYPRDSKTADQIRRASTHWLRHTYGSHAVARGVPADVVQSNLGHESLATTSIYVRAEKGRRHRAVQQAFSPREVAR